VDGRTDVPTDGQTFPPLMLLSRLGVDLKTGHAAENLEILQHKINIKINPGLVTLYDIWPGNGIGIWLQPWSHRLMERLFQD